MGADQLAPVQLRRITRAAKEKAKGKSVEFRKVHMGGHWNHIRYVAAVEDGPEIVIFTAPG